MKREKLTSQRSAQPVSWKEGRLMRLLPIVLLWAVSLFLLNVDRLSPLPEEIGEIGLVFPLLGQGLFLLVGLLAAGIFLHIFDPKLLKDRDRIHLLTVIALISVATSSMLLHLPEILPNFRAETTLFALPFVLAPMLAATLTGGAAAIAVGGWCGLAMSLAAGQDFTIVAAALSASVVTALLSLKVRKRTQALKVGMVAGFFAILCLLAFHSLGWDNPDITLRLTASRSAACLTSGILSSVAALLLLPLFEMFFPVTTDITLLEFSDLGHPLLQRLALEAPGTYHHSLVVAHLSQAAADEIGANALLARTASYFHDIGKLVKPNFFSENIMHKSPHDNIPPSMSTLVITSHVKEGISLALLHKLPESIQRILREHHGTSLVSYFHHKAKEQMELGLQDQEPIPNKNASTQVSEIDFRYPGPRPATRESGIVCLADAVEAASRSMEKTSPTHIEGLVNELVHNRIEDGQLDQCDLTVAEVAKIRHSFVFSLTNMLHGRIPYPKGPRKN